MAALELLPSGSTSRAMCGALSDGWSRCGGLPRGGERVESVHVLLPSATEDVLAAPSAGCSAVECAAGATELPSSGSELEIAAGP